MFLGGFMLYLTRATPREGRSWGPGCGRKGLSWAGAAPLRVWGAGGSPTGSHVAGLGSSLPPLSALGTGWRGAGSRCRFSSPLQPRRSGSSSLEKASSEVYLFISLLDLVLIEFNASVCAVLLCRSMETRSE